MSSPALANNVQRPTGSMTSATGSLLLNSFSSRYVTSGRTPLHGVNGGVSNVERDRRWTRDYRIRSALSWHVHNEA